MARPSRHLIAVTVSTLALSACVSAPSTPRPPADTSSTAAAPETVAPVGPVALAPRQPDSGIAVVPPGGAPLSSAPGAEPFVLAHEGLVFAVRQTLGDWQEVMTGCDTFAWVPREAVDFEPTSQQDAPGPGFDLTTAVIVLDPGHGGPNVGAQGPSGLDEGTVNREISLEVEQLLSSSHDIDWETGAILPGDEYPAVGRVLLTRTEGPPGADFEAGLAFRALLATTAGADALISIHNNAAPEGPISEPGSEVFYSVRNRESKRLAGILYEELMRSLSRFDLAWMGNSDRGARYRLSRQGFVDYYGILRRAEVPTVISEGAFISNPAEEAALRTPEFKRAYAGAIYRAVIRFLTTNDQGSGWSDPIPVTAPVAGRGDARPDCRVPAQPGT